MSHTASTRRQRADGTWTFTDETWDTHWHFSIGQSVRLVDTVTPIRLRGSLGVVTKTHSVSVDVLLQDGVTLKRVPMPSVEKV